MGQLPGRYNRAAIFRIFIFSLISEGGRGFTQIIVTVWILYWIVGRPVA